MTANLDKKNEILHLYNKRLQKIIKLKVFKPLRFDILIVIYS